MMSSVKRLDGRLGLAASLAALVLALGACGGDDEAEGGGGGSASTGEVKELEIALPGSGVAFYGWYAAQFLGYFEDEGLEVNLVSTGGSAESAQLLGAGRADVGEAAADQLLTVMSKVEVYPFYNFWEQEFRAWVVPDGSPLQDVGELAGKTVGVTQMSGGEVPLVRAVLASEGILEDVEIVSVGNQPATVLSSFEKNRIDSYAGEAQTIIAMTARDFATRSILPTLLAKGPLVPTAVSEELKDDRETMAAIGRAVAKGSLFCITNVQACVGVIKEGNPAFVPDEELAIKTVEEGYFPNTAPEKVDGKYVFGTTNTLEGWQKLLEIYSSGPDPLIKDPDAIDLESMVVTDLVDEINDFDYDAVVSAAESWEAR